MEDSDSKSKRHKEPKEYMEHKMHKKHKTYQVAAWTFGAVSVVLVILLAVSIGTNGFGGSGTGKTLSSEEVKAKTVAYVEAAVPGQTVTVSEVKDLGDLYSVKLNVGGQEFSSYARKDGSLLFPTGIDLTGAPAPTDTTAQPAQTNIPKSDKPKVELFVMSHCPYGTQSEKGILPAVRTLGDKVDFEVKFVYYAMHGDKEIKEQLTQYCIDKEYPDKYLSYLACFLNDTAGQGSAAASDACIASLKLDTAKLTTCKTAADTEFSITKNFNDQSTWLSGRFPRFDIHKADNEKYGVGGSPTLIINGVESSAGRSPTSYLSAICGAFNTAPAECQTQLDATNPGPGFGYGTTAAAAAAGCGV